MANRIYTQEDYDKVTDMYNAYQAKKDTYSPEKQKQIEDMFSNAWTTVSNGIEESKNKIADMRGDDKWNTWAMYWDWRKEIINQAPVQQPKQVSKPNPKPKNNEKPTVIPEQPSMVIKNDWWNEIVTEVNWIKLPETLPEWYTKEDIEKRWLVWPQTDADDILKAFDPYKSRPSDIVAALKEKWYTDKEIAPVIEKWQAKMQKDLDALNASEWWSKWEQPSTKWNTNTNKKTNTKVVDPIWDLLNWIRTFPEKVQYVVNTMPIRAEWVVDTLKATPDFVNNVKATKAWIDQIKNWNIVEKVQWWINTIKSLPWTIKSTNDMLEWINKIQNNYLSTTAIKRLLNQWYRMSTDWTIYNPDWTVFMKLKYPVSL